LVRVFAHDQPYPSDFLFDVAIEMEPEEGLIWVLGLGDESLTAFTDDWVDSLVELIKIHREKPPRPRADLCREIAAPAAYGVGLLITAA
jgi:hypothetical protein